MTEDRRTVRPNVSLVSYARVRLAVSRGPDSGRSLELTNLPLRVGTSSESDLVLTDAKVAARHCALEPVREGIRIRDEGSGAPVFLGSLRVFDAIAEPPFELSLGQSSLSLEPLSTSEEREQSVAERFGDLWGSSARMRELFAELGRVALGEGNVLIEGERGSGRELVAESIHDASRRATGPFVVVRCNELSEATAGDEQADARPAVLEQEMAFERAAQGTIYLHEITALSVGLQVALARRLAGRRERTGGHGADARLLTSSSKNLSVEVERGGFLAELFQALSLSIVRIPPLRDRIEDVPLLASHFLSRAHPSWDPTAIPRSLWNALSAYSWPGNVRELWSALDALVSGAPLHPEGPEGSRAASDAPSPSSEIAPLRIARRNAAEEFERSYLAALLARTEGNVTRAAAIAEVSRQMVQKLQRKHKVG